MKTSTESRPNVTTDCRTRNNGKCGNNRNAITRALFNPDEWVQVWNLDGSTHVGNIRGIEWVGAGIYNVKMIGTSGAVFTLCCRIGR